MTPDAVAIFHLQRARDGTFVLDPIALDRLAAALDRLGCAPVNARWVPLEALLRLATALDEKLGSPEAAKRIRLMVRASPWALRLLVAHSGGELQRRTQRWFARFSGEPRRRRS
jgi:hypothetical protein